MSDEVTLFYPSTFTFNLYSFFVTDFPLEGPSDNAAAVNAAVERGDLSVDQLLHGMNK